MATPRPARGEIWYVELSHTRGHEQADGRPALVISEDTFNYGPAGLIIILPITSTVRRDIPFRVLLKPPEGGVKVRSMIQCDQIRCVSKDRLGEPWGAVSSRTMTAVEDRLRILLEL